MSLVPRSDCNRTDNNWLPTSSSESMQLRANTLRAIRHFFDQNDVLEVDTPTLSVSTVPDPFVESFKTYYLPLTQQMQKENFYLHTSPEFPMKRLLSSGSGSIYQVSKVFRQGESGCRHNPEFTLLEWYRVDWDHHQLMNEVDKLLKRLVQPYRKLAQSCFISYRDIFEQMLGINPHRASQEELINCAEQQGLGNVLEQNEHRDRYLELLFSHVIEPELGKSKETNQVSLCFIFHYPASQASLAKAVQKDGDDIAERFEVFIDGMELGNGFHELNDSHEQRRRFVADNQIRRTMGLSEVPLDEYFLKAVESLPDCAGVAIGIERLLMVMSQAQHINEVINFPLDRA